MKILVIADIHGNAEALRAVLDAEPDADTTVFLGDAVSPGPQANETVALLEDLTGTFIIGNHDLEMLEPERTADWPEDWKAYNDWVVETFEPGGFEYLKSLHRTATTLSAVWICTCTTVSSPTARIPQLPTRSMTDCSNWPKAARPGTYCSVIPMCSSHGPSAFSNSSIPAAWVRTAAAICWLVMACSSMGCTSRVRSHSIRRPGSQP